MRHSCFVWAWVIGCTYIVTAIITVHPFFKFQISFLNWKSSTVFFVKIVWVWGWMSNTFFLILCSSCIILNIFWFEIVWNGLIFMLILLIIRIQIFMLLCIGIQNILIIFTIIMHIAQKVYILVYFFLFHFL